MAGPYYVDSVAGSNTSPFDTWAKAATTLKAATDLAGVGEDIYVAQTHAETQAATVALAFAGTPASPIRIICANKAGTVPPVSADLATTATVSTTGAFSITMAGSAHIYGITFNNGSGSGSAQTFAIANSTQSHITFNKCALKMLQTTSGANIVFGGTGAVVGMKIDLQDTTVELSAAGQGLALNASTDLRWWGPLSTITGPTAFPNNLFMAISASGGNIVVDGVDLSPLTGKNLVAAQSKGGRFYFKDCKLPASITTYTVPTSPSVEIFVIRSASGATAYNMEKHNLRGDQTTETTVVRTGGAAVNSTPVAMKIVGTAGAKTFAPFESTPLVIGNTSTGGAKTITVYGYWSGAAVPTDKQVWMEVGYLGSALTPQLAFDKGTSDILHAGTNQAADTSTWGALGGTPTKFKMTATFTPNLAGEIYVIVKTASTNTTYIDPLPVLS